MALSVLLIAGAIASLRALTESRTFVPEDLATIADATATAKPIPVAGLQIFMTHESAGNIRRLMFTVDTARIAQVDQGLGAGPEPALAGQTYEIAMSSGGFGATFETLWNTSIAPVTSGGVTRVLIPYVVAEGGCQFNQFGQFPCGMTEHTTFLNGDTDPFDSVLFYAEIQIDAAGTATIVHRAHNTQVAAVYQGMVVTPGLSGGVTVPKIVLTHYESEKDYNCTASGNSLNCNPPNVLGVDRNGDGYFSDIVAVYDTPTQATVYTSLKVGQSVYGFNTPNGCGTQPAMDVDGFGIVGGSAGLVAFTSQEFPATEFMDGGGIACSLPARPITDYNGDGDGYDRAMRYSTVDQLTAGAALTMGAMLSNSSSFSLFVDGALWAADAERIYYAVEEGYFPAPVVPGPPIPGVPAECTDLNEDCDNGDFVILAFDPNTGISTSLKSSMVETPGVSHAENGIVAFATREIDERDGFNMGTDLNGDGVAEDVVLRFYEINTGTLVTTNITLEDYSGGFPLNYHVRPATDGEVIVYGSIVLPIGQNTPTDLKLIRLPGSGGGDDPIVCQAGSYLANPAALTCTLAPPGSYVPNAGATSATLCAPGSYQPASGQTSCSLASPGTFVSGSGATAATPCPPGTTSGIGAIACTATDNQPPSIAPHADITVAPSNGSAAFVTYTAPATTDNVDPPGVATCAPPSGSLFFTGTTLVKCSATDVAGNLAQSSFNVIVVPACVAGAYRAQPGDLFCTPAPPGSYVDTDGASMATPCAVGTYQSLAGQTSCVNAPAGSFVDTVGATTSTECPAGAYQPATGQTKCLLAPPGSFVSGTGQKTSTSCAVGTYQPASGASSCLDAPAGTFVNATGQTSATQCAPGSYQPDAGQIACLASPPGTFVDTVGATAPTPCPAGMTSGEGATKCTDNAPPSIAPHDDITVPPSNGSAAFVTYTAPATTDNVDPPGVATCVPPSDSLFFEGTTLVKCSATDAAGNTAHSSFNVTVVPQCAVGTYRARPGDLFCTPAPPGSFVDTVGATTATECAVGTYQPLTGQTACVSAPAGSFVDTVGATTSTECPVGAYQPATGQTRCLLASPGSFVSGTGQKTSTSCAVGTYQPASGASSCIDAPAGSYVDFTGASSASPCAPGTYQSLTGQSACVAAPAGSFVAGSGASSATPCAVGTFSSAAGATACTNAPPGSFVDSLGATTSTLCAAGSYQPNAGQASCILSPAGSYVPNAGATAPIACPAGTSSGVGATSCTDSIPPVVTVTPAGNQTLTATSAAGAVANFTATATDSHDGSVSASCLPPSGSTFPIGTTIVTCSATDAAGNTGSKSFSVIVNDDEATEGRMQGDGSVDSPTATGRFDFNVREREPNGERGRMVLEVNYKAKGRKNDTFRSRTVTSVVFSDDPGFKPGRKNRPTIDSVTFTGEGTFNGVAGHTYVTRATDRGEPGRGIDTFEITVRNAGGAIVATFSGVIQTGNIQSLRLRGR